MSDDTTNHPHLWRNPETRNRIGRPRKFVGPKELWDAACGYFEWVVANPLEEEKVFQNNGDIVYGRLNRIRAMTLKGLLIHLGISNYSWYDWKEGKSRDDLVDVIEMIENVIFEQKFTGAAASLLNPGLIIRDLGLAEKSELSGPEGKPIEYVDRSPRDRLAERLATLASRGRVDEPEDEGLELDDPEDDSDLL